VSYLSGRVSLVTGASRGIGRAIAIALAAAGSDVIVNYREREDAAREVERSIRAMGRKCLSVQADVSKASEVSRMIEEVRQQFAAIDVLVNNAGIARAQPIEQVTEQDWDDLQDGNVKSAFLVSQALLPSMRTRQWGRIIFISSVAAQVGGVVGPHYAASKAGMHGLMHFYAAHLAKEGITANAIAPALIETDMVAANLNAKPDRIPVGRFGHVDEVAAVAVMLAGNAYITGQTINVNGGWYLT
jgi:3-oxoacyl-[acyl-carrier protein] reductase